jgi:hypothetical protein
VQGYWSGIGVEEKITVNGLLDAWDQRVQDEAWARRALLFANLSAEDDPNGNASGDIVEPVHDAEDAGFRDEEPGIEEDLRTAGVLRGSDAAPAPTAPQPDVSTDEAIAFLDAFVARLDARMAAAGTALPVAANAQAVIAEVTANADAAATNEADEEEEEASEEETSEEEGADEEADAESEEQEEDTPPVAGGAAGGPAS